MPLTDTRMRSLKPGSRPKRYSDGYGLYAEVTPGGSKLWKMGYRFEGKQKTPSVGPYPQVSLGRVAHFYLLPLDFRIAVADDFPATVERCCR